MWHLETVLKLHSAEPIVPESEDLSAYSELSMPAIVLSSLVKLLGIGVSPSAEHFTA